MHHSDVLAHLVPNDQPFGQYPRSNERRIGKGLRRDYQVEFFAFGFEIAFQSAEYRKAVRPTTYEAFCHVGHINYFDTFIILLQTRPILFAGNYRYIVSATPKADCVIDNHRIANALRLLDFTSAECGSVKNRVNYQYVHRCWVLAVSAICRIGCI